MERGLPILTWDGSQHLGEYARMNDKGQFERETVTWTEDDSLDSSRARYADWYDDYGYEFGCRQFLLSAWLSRFPWRAKGQLEL